MKITWVPSPDYKHRIASCLNFRYSASQHGLFNVYFKKCTQAVQNYVFYLTVKDADWLVCHIRFLLDWLLANCIPAHF